MDGSPLYLLHMDIKQSKKFQFWRDSCSKESRRKHSLGLVWNILGNFNILKTHLNEMTNSSLLGIIAHTPVASSLAYSVITLNHSLTQL